MVEEEKEICPSCGYPSHAGHAPNCESVKERSLTEGKETNKFDLNNALGPDWKERAFSGSLDPKELAALTSEVDPEMAEQRKVQLPKSVQDSFDATRIVLRENGSNAKVKLVETESGHKILVQSQIDSDIVYAFMEPNRVVGTVATGEKLMSVFVPQKFGVFNPQSGATFSLDRVVDIDKMNNIAFMEIEGKRHKHEMQLTSIKKDGSGEFDTMTNFPLNSQELANLFHEVGHRIRVTEHVSRGDHERRAAAYAIAEGKLQAGADDLDSARQALISEERGADAISLTLLRELRKAGFSSASANNLAKIKKRNELYLQTYDGEPFVPADRLEKRKIAPQFSNTMRAEAKKLARFLKERGLDESSLNNFDPDTGKSVGNNPKRQREILEKD